MRRLDVIEVGRGLGTSIAGGFAFADAHLGIVLVSYGAAHIALRHLLSPSHLYARCAATIGTLFDDVPPLFAAAFASLLRRGRCKNGIRTGSAAALRRLRGGLLMSAAALRRLRGGLPMSAAALSRLRGGLPMSAAALRRLRGRLPMSAAALRAVLGLPIATTALRARMSLRQQR